MNIINHELSLIKQSIQSVPHYPKMGVLFRDISPLLENHKAYAASIELLAQHYRHYKLTKIVSVESRGFLFGAPLALILNLGFVPVRKAGKLPRDTISESYFLEYGTSYLEIHDDSIYSSDKVLVVDDVLATGGTIQATVKLIRRLGGEVNHAAFIIHLGDFGGKNVLTQLGVTSYSLIMLPDH